MQVDRIGPLLVKNPTDDIFSRYKVESEDFFTGEISFLKLFVEYGDSSVLIPRYANIGISPSSSILSEGDSIDISTSAKPRNDIQKSAVDFILEHKDCLINLAPRRGKTVIAIMAISKLKRKTLILVDQTNILEQWKDRIVSFTNLDPEDIGIFKGGIQELNKPIVIGMVQTLKNHVLKDIHGIRAKLKNFGVVIVDEVHTIIGTEKLSLPLYSISAERLIGLTATTYRSDSRDFLFTEWFSDKIFSDKKYDIVPIIYMLPISGYMTSRDINYIMKNYFNNNGTMEVKNYFNKLKWTKKLQKNNPYLDKLSLLIFMLFKKGRTILVLSEYIDLLQCIAIKLCGFGVDIGDIELYADSSGQSKSIKKLLEPSRKNNKKITLSTYKMCNKAVDRPDWDALVMATHISVSSPSLEQSIGRVCTLCDGKKDSVIYDVYDNTVPRLQTMANARKNFYENLGCIVKEF